MFIAVPSDWLVAELYNTGLQVFEDVGKDAMLANTVANSATENPATQPHSESALFSIPWAWWALLVCLTAWVGLKDISVSTTGVASTIAKPVFLVDLNSASVAELAALPEVGESLAVRIVEYRKVHGPYLQIEELTEVRGVGAQTLEQLRPMLSLGNNQPVQTSVDAPPSLTLDQQPAASH